MWAPKSNLFHFWKQFASMYTFFYFYSCDSEIILFMMEIIDKRWSSSTVWNFQNLEIEVAALFMTVAFFSTMLPHLRCCGLNQLQFAGCLVLETIWKGCEEFMNSWLLSDCSGVGPGAAGVTVPSNIRSPHIMALRCRPHWLLWCLNYLSWIVQNYVRWRGKLQD